jgi:hypothetical protein
MNNENLTLHFKVKDFNAWQASYNGNEKNRKSAGITKSKVFRSADDPNDVLLLQDVADVSKARTRQRTCASREFWRVLKEKRPSPGPPD